MKNSQGYKGHFPQISPILIKSTMDNTVPSMGISEKMPLINRIKVTTMKWHETREHLERTYLFSWWS